MFLQNLNSYEMDDGILCVQVNFYVKKGVAAGSLAIFQELIHSPP